MGIDRRTVLMAGLVAVSGCSWPGAGGPTTPASGVPTSDASAATLTLLRHGESMASVRGILSTAVPGEGLTGEGRAQAERAAHALAPRAFDAVFSSPLVRALETAAAVGSLLGLPVAASEGVREIEAGAYEGLPAVDYAAEFLALIDRWTHGDLDPRIPEGESGHEFLARMDTALASVSASGARNAVVVSHGEAIRCWAGNRLKDNLSELHLNYTGYLVVSPGGNGWTLREVRPDGH